MAPELVWAGAHSLDHRGHGIEANSDRHLAEVLVHGHEHQEGTPDHEHSLLPAPAIRLDAVKGAEVAEVAFLKNPAGQAPLLSGNFSAWSIPRLDGPSPPILQLLCALLI